MSSSVGYYVSAADIEARRQRELRADIAALRARLAATRGRAAAIGLTVSAYRSRRTGANDRTEELEAEVGALRAEIDRAESELDAGWTQHWSGRIARSRPAAASARAKATATEQLADRRQREAAQGEAAQGTAAGDADRARQVAARQAVVADVERLLTRSGARCDSDDLARLADRVQQLSTTDRADTCRTMALEIAVEVRESVERRRRTDAAAEHRARLLDLLADVPAEDSAALADSIRTASDPGRWETMVHQAVERVDRARARERVAAVAAAALADAGCELGDDFATLLATQHEAVVSLGRGPDYGLLVRLPTDGNRLLAAVVRADGAPDEDRLDVAAQQTFCDDILPEFTKSMRDSGVGFDPEPFARIEPGVRPVRPVPPGDWSRRAVPAQSKVSRPQPARQQLRERHHGG